MFTTGEKQVGSTHSWSLVKPDGYHLSYLSFPERYTFAFLVPAQDAPAQVGRLWQAMALFTKTCSTFTFHYTFFTSRPVSSFIFAGASYLRTVTSNFELQLFLLCEVQL
jgi:hypothetical protein